MTVYLDHASTTPVRPVVAEAVAQTHAAGLGNPSSLHAAGRAARRVVEESREEIGALLGARPSEVVLTAGGTEADNLAVVGTWWARRAEDPTRTRVLLSAVEHHAVLDPAAWLARHAGAEVVPIPVDAEGVVDLEWLAAELREHGHRTAVVSVMAANNEIGTVQPVAEVARLCREASVPLHTDAVQAVVHLPVHMDAYGVDALTVSAHKLGGPVGAGLLVVRRDLRLEPVLHGGGQERGVRSGTVDAAAARATAVALAAAVAEQEVEAERVGRLRDRLVAGIRTAVPDAVLRGAAPGPGRLPANAHLTFPGCEGDSLLYLLDSHGVQVSTGSACRAGVPQPSHVLTACGVPDVDARGALRFSFGWTSQQSDVDRVLAVLPEVVSRARAAGLAGAGPAAGG